MKKRIEYYLSSKRKDLRRIGQKLCHFRGISYWIAVEYIRGMELDPLSGLLTDSVECTTNVLVYSCYPIEKFHSWEEEIPEINWKGWTAPPTSYIRPISDLRIYKIRPRKARENEQSRRNSKKENRSIFKK